MNLLRSARRSLLASLALAAPLTVVACGSSSEGAGDTAAGAQTKTPVASAACPSPDAIAKMDDLTKLSADCLETLFQADSAKKNTTDRFHGKYDGIPLCRTEVIPSYDELPPNVKQIMGASAAVRILGFSTWIDNALAGVMWHGKHFFEDLNFKDQNGNIDPRDPWNSDDPSLRPPMDKESLCHREDGNCGAVLNYIDPFSLKGITDNTDQAANAVDFLDEENKWIVLNYAGSTTAGVNLPILEGIGIAMIRQIYDTVRLINPQSQVYLGMAYLVDKPGEIDKSHLTKTCYFALTPHKE